MGSVPVHFALDRCITRKGSRRHRFVVCANHRFVQKAGRCSRGWAGVFAGPAMAQFEMDGDGALRALFPCTSSCIIAGLGKAPGGFAGVPPLNSLLRRSAIWWDASM